MAESHSGNGKPTGVLTGTLKVLPDVISNAFFVRKVVVLGAGVGKDFYGRKNIRADAGLYQAIIDSYLETGSVLKTSRALSVSEVKVRRVLLTEGL